MGFASAVDNYEVVSVEEADAPRGLAGEDWHRYTICQGENTIQGYRRGDLATVTQSVEAIVTRLNERRAGKRGRVHLAMTAREGKSGGR